jgi:hypothetical protein
MSVETMLRKTISHNLFNTAIRPCEIDVQSVHARIVDRWISLRQVLLSALEFFVWQVLKHRRTPIQYPTSV